MKKQYLDMMQFFDGYVRNYRRMNLSNIHNLSMFTQREIDYFSNLGEMLGFDSFVEDGKFDKQRGRSRPMDLAWWKWDERIDKENYVHLALHLERESLCNKDEDTIEKLFSETEEGYIPHNVVGIQYVESSKRIDFLNSLVIKRNATQKSNALMVYRLYNSEYDVERVTAYLFNTNGLSEQRSAICKRDELGYWFMCFEEEYETLQRTKEEFNGNRRGNAVCSKG